MISFREHSFKKINQENFCMRSNDYRKFNPNFAILSSSVYAKPELREEIAEKEVRDAYLYAAEILVEKHHSEIDENKKHGILAEFRNNSPAMPTIYLMRHAVELSLKRAIRKAGGDPGKNHDLKELFEKYEDMFAKANIKDAKTLKNLGDFVRIIYEIDDTGTKLRYSKNKKGFAQNKILWVNEMEFLKSTKFFIRQIEDNAADDNKSCGNMQPAEE